MLLFLRTLIFTLLLPAAVTVYIPFILLNYGRELCSLPLGVFRFIGIFPAALGVGIYVWSAWDFGHFGKGTPAVYDPPKFLVTRGAYAHTRNPLFIGVGSLLLGEAIFFESLTLLLYTTAFFLVAHLFVVLFEEPGLKKKYGASYDAYRQSVPRWISAVNWLKHIKREVKVYQLVLKDKRTPLAAKVLLGLAIGYLLMPFELIPDFIPVIGYLDDLLIVGLLVYLALKLIPKQVVEEARKSV